MNARVAARAALTTAALTTVLLLGTGVAPAFASHEVSSVTSGGPRPYPGNPETEAKLVASEDARLIRVRALSDTATRLGVAQSRPYRLAVGSTPTAACNSGEP